MKILKHSICLLILMFVYKPSSAQVDENQLGAWYMLFLNGKTDGNWGYQSDIQYRNWNLGGDLEQLLLRAALTYTPDNYKVKFSLGAGHITTGAFGSSDNTSEEFRIFEEALIPTSLGPGTKFTNRFRYEQRWVQDQDTRTRYRYQFVVTKALNKNGIQDKSFYLAFYNEIFINGEKNIGSGKSVELFDRNRVYGALGYAVKKDARIQLGVMNQSTNSVSKNQMQLSFHWNIQH